jgi:flagellar hook assembly protein FlgD
MLVYPNPFNPATTVTFALPEAGRARLAVYDLRGRLVRTLADESFSVGPQQVPWDGRDDQGNPLASGVYFGKLTLPGGKGEIVQKMALIR